MKMTSLFNSFCPLVISFSIVSSSITNCLVYLFIFFLFSNLAEMKSYKIFPSMTKYLVLSTPCFYILVLTNASSLNSFSYPLTTSLGFNLSMAFSFWFFSFSLIFSKKNFFSSSVPKGSPWYLASILCLIEIISLGIRSITLCFRLLANMGAGHVLLALLCKANSTFLMMNLFSLLEIMVSLVQAIVFIMLISVYVEEVNH